MNKKSNNSIMALAIAAILAGGSVLVSNEAYADSNSNEHSSSHDDDDEHSNSDSGNEGESKKITICHVPPGHPENKHTIHIAYSAWAAHKEHGRKEDGDKDYLGSCNNPPSTSTTTTTTVDPYVVVENCSTENRQKLIELTQSYSDPLIVNSGALEDEATTTALSECLDKGDSSDSSKSGSDKDKPSKGKGGGHDSVSDSGHHHHISGCKNKDSSEAKSSDSSKNYRKKLELKRTAFNTKSHHGDSSLDIPVRSLDDSNVFREYKKCEGHDSDIKKKIKRNKKGDSGHKYLKMKSCSGLKDAVEDYKFTEKTETSDAPIILSSSSLQDKSISKVVEDCGGARATGNAGRLNWREITN